MQMISNRKRIVESTYSPEDTNVLWVDLSEDKERKVKSIKEYKNGKWEEMIDNNGEEEGSELNPNFLQSKYLYYLQHQSQYILERLLKENNEDPEVSKFTIFKAKFSIISYNNFPKILLPNTDILQLHTDNCYALSCSNIIPILQLISDYEFFKRNSYSHISAAYSILSFKDIDSEEINSSDIKELEVVILCGNNSSYETVKLPEWFIEKYKAE